METEIFKPIHGYEGLYEISNLGSIKSLPRLIYNGVNYTSKIKILYPHINNGYYTIGLTNNIGGKIKIRIHRLIAIHFIPNPENKPQINHIDGNKLNNCIENLEWCTQKENNIHSIRILGNRTSFQNNPPNKGKFGKLHHNSKKINQYDINGNFIKTWDCGMDIKRQLGYNRGNIVNCCNGKYKTAGGYIWKYL